MKNNTPLSQKEDTSLESTRRWFLTLIAGTALSTLVACQPRSDIPSGTEIVLVANKWDPNKLIRDMLDHRLNTLLVSFRAKNKDFQDNGSSKIKSFTSENITFSIQIWTEPLSQKQYMSVMWVFNGKELSFVYTEDGIFKNNASAPLSFTDLAVFVWQIEPQM